MNIPGKTKENSAKHQTCFHYKRIYPKMDSSLTEGPSGEIVHGVPDYKLQCNHLYHHTIQNKMQIPLKNTRDRNID